MSSEMRDNVQDFLNVDTCYQQVKCYYISVVL